MQSFDSTFQINFVYLLHPNLVSKHFQTQVISNVKFFEVQTTYVGTIGDLPMRKANDKVEPNPLS